MRTYVSVVFCAAILAACGGGSSVSPPPGVGGGSPPPTMAPQLVEYAIPTSNSGPSSITLGPDGNLWFTEAGAGKVADITPAGSITEFPLPSPSPATYYVHGGIAAGADGKLWFDFRQCNSHLTGGIFRECDPVVIDTITPNGSITGFQFSGSAFCSSVGRLTAGPDGNVWFTDPCANKIGRITTSGVITEFTIPGPSVGAIGGIVAGPDHNLWFIAPKGSALVDATLKVDRVTTTSGVISEYAIPAPALRPNGVYCTDSIAPGPDGNLWFTECGANRIGRITTEGNITEFPIPTLNSLPAGITTGPDGNVWFTESSADQLGRITMTGAVTEFPVRMPNSSPGDITSGPGGTLWFTESSVNKIGRITP